MRANGMNPLVVLDSVACFLSCTVSVASDAAATAETAAAGTAT